MAEYRLLDPVDVLYLRGNRLFGDAGAHGEALMPPWPSLAAGSLRTRILIDYGHNPKAYGSGELILPEPLSSILGTPMQPGTFRISLFTLARNAGEFADPLFPLPADLVAQQQDESLKVVYLQPIELKAPVQYGCPLPYLPVLRTSQPFKPEPGLWLNAEGFAAYLTGRPIIEEHLVRSRDLWQLDSRLGIALDEYTRTAATGRIYTAEAVALRRDVGFVVGIQGADAVVPGDGLLRFGGDGRSVWINRCRPRLADPPWSRIEQEGRFRMILATPGVFSEGWIPANCRLDAGDWVLHGPGFRARLVSATLPRHDVVSGWDIAQQKPKRAWRVAPAGSVYWFDRLEGRLEGLKQLVHDGLWPAVEQLDPARRAEGFNNIFVGAWVADDH